MEGNVFFHALILLLGSAVSSKVDFSRCAKEAIFWYDNPCMSSPRTIVFIFGGPGVEHEVSCATAQSCLPHFPSSFMVRPVFITREGKWVVADDYVAPEDAWGVAQALLSQKGQPLDIALDAIEKGNPEVVFIGLHGEFGEDGTLQSLLEARGLAFTGSDAVASALAMNKPAVLELLQSEDIRVPEFLEITATTPLSDIEDFAMFHSYPIVIMPADRGSSVGVHIVRTAEEIPAARSAVESLSDRALVSEYIEGAEFSCGMLVTGTTELTALPPTEIVLKGDHTFWDYDAKYVPGECEEITPPHRPEALIQEMQALARRVHRLVGADGYSRTDMILTKNDELCVLEINTLPGITPTSVIPAQAKAHGLTFAEFLTLLCDNIDTSGSEYLTAA